MSLAYFLSEGENTIKFYQKDFDINKTYSIKLEPVNFCFPSKTVDIDGVSFCADNVELTFSLPCISSGAYHLQIFDQIDMDNYLYQFNSIFQ